MRQGHIKHLMIVIKLHYTTINVIQTDSGLKQPTDDRHLHPAFSVAE